MNRGVEQINEKCINNLSWFFLGLLCAFAAREKGMDAIAHYSCAELFSVRGNLIGSNSFIIYYNSSQVLKVIYII